jgi:hypothetical protein
MKVSSRSATAFLFNDLQRQLNWPSTRDESSAGHMLEDRYFQTSGTVSEGWLSRERSSAGSLEFAAQFGTIMK